MSSPERSRPRGAPRVYALFCGIFLFLQGTSTLAARLFPAVDRALPALLGTTHMRPVHSLLHIATAILAFAVLRRGASATRSFALLFGGFYFALGFFGWLTGRDLGMFGLHLQSFDHPFHLLLGGLGLIAAAIGSRSVAKPRFPGEGFS